MDYSIFQCRFSLSVCSLFVLFVLISDPSVDVSGPSHLASDSDSEVYCDSVDQFGQEEARNHQNPLFFGQ